MLRGWLPQVLPHSRQRSSYVLVPIFATSFCDCGTSLVKIPQLTQNPFSEWEKRLGKCESISLTRISWSPLPGESWHLRWRYMIPIRLPWRPRARPSATLHEIPVCSNKEQTWNWILQPTNRSVKRVYSVGQNPAIGCASAASATLPQWTISGL